MTTNPYICPQCHKPITSLDSIIRDPDNYKIYHAFPCHENHLKVVKGIVKNLPMRDIE